MREEGGGRSKKETELEREEGNVSIGSSANLCAHVLRNFKLLFCLGIVYFTCTKHGNTC